MKVLIFSAILCVFCIVPLTADWEEYPTNAGWPYHKYPAIEGRVIDMVTGEPIENVLITIVWVKEIFPIISFAGNSIISDSDAEDILTDEDGRWRVSSKISFHLLSSPEGVVVYIHHPLYVGKQIMIIYPEPDERYPLKKKYKFVYNPDGEMKDGKLFYTIELTSLEDKFINQVEDRSKANLDRLVNREYRLCFGYYSGGYYFLYLRKYNKDFNLDEIFKKWGEIGESLSSDESYAKGIKIDINDTEESIKKALGEQK